MFAVGEVSWNKEVKNHDSVNRGLVFYVTSCLFTALIKSTLS